MEIATLYTTCPDEKTAEAIAHTLVSARLAACTNTYPIKSTYRWEGKMHQDDEIGLLCKTSLAKVDELVERLGELHPYEVPAVLISIQKTTDKYGMWVEGEVGD